MYKTSLSHKNIHGKFSDNGAVSLCPSVRRSLTLSIDLSNLYMYRNYINFKCLYLSFLVDLSGRFYVCFLSQVSSVNIKDFFCHFLAYTLKMWSLENLL